MPLRMQTTLEGRKQLLDAVALAAEALGYAVGSLGAAYEQLDEARADELEDELFRPVQRAYGRARRTYTGFAARHGLEARALQERPPGLPSTGVKGFIENAAGAVSRADAELAELQDSLLPIEVGDAQVRKELAELRELIGGFAQRSRKLVGTIGR
jgi:hypothetical protein